MVNASVLMAFYASDDPQRDAVLGAAGIRCRAAYAGVPGVGHAGDLVHPFVVADLPQQVSHRPYSSS